MEAIKHLGIDEKSFRSGHQYVTPLNDLNGCKAAKERAFSLARHVEAVCAGCPEIDSSIRYRA